jgi:hypothetical protein
MFFCEPTSECTVDTAINWLQRTITSDKETRKFNAKRPKPQKERRLSFHTVSVDHIHNNSPADMTNKKLDTQYFQRKFPRKTEHKQNSLLLTAKYPTPG